MISLAVLWLPLFALASSDEEDLERRLHAAKMELWARGAFALDEFRVESVQDQDVRNHVLVAGLEQQVKLAPTRYGPIRTARRDYLEHDCIDCDDDMWSNLLKMRGGASVDVENKLQDLSKTHGQQFVDALERNKREHADDCELSCKMFYCASPDDLPKPWESTTTTFRSYSFGAVPPEDFAGEFGFPLDLIKVTEGEPLFSPDQASRVVTNAEAEGVHLNEYESGKYKLGGDWLINLPSTRAWFNEKLETTFFPILAYLFPEIISSPAVLRAHSVSLLKYNSTHPRTDVHVDNGILALTIAMTPSNQYEGGGTFFEHMGNDVLAMDVGHGTFRPGSVRHGGHKVTSGTRYILGAFLLIEDRVEHVRRLKNRGSELRREGDLMGAAKHFEWALAINPKCTTCLKDWAELLLAKKDYKEAEAKIRTALELLEEHDSDALFTLGIILSEQGRDDESIAAYIKSVELNADDAELCYNLAVKYGARGDTKNEMIMYAKATAADPKFGKAWINWGASLAEAGNLEDAEVMFLKALQCPGSQSQAMMNLSLVQQKLALQRGQSGDLEGAKNLIQQAANYLDSAKPILDQEVESGEEDAKTYSASFERQRIECHRTAAMIFASMQDFASCEQEFRTAIKNFPHVVGLWEALARVLDAQGRADEAMKARETFRTLSQR